MKGEAKAIWTFSGYSSIFWFQASVLCDHVSQNWKSAICQPKLAPPKISQNWKSAIMRAKIGSASTRNQQSLKSKLEIRNDESPNWDQKSAIIKVKIGTAWNQLSPFSIFKVNSLIIISLLLRLCVPNYIVWRGWKEKYWKKLQRKFILWKMFSLKYPFSEIYIPWDICFLKRKISRELRWIYILWLFPLSLLLQPTLRQKGEYLEGELLRHF